MVQTNRNKAMIRIIRDIRDLSLSTSDVKFLKDELERIWAENLAQEQILRYINNSAAYKKACQPIKKKVV